MRRVTLLLILAGMSVALIAQERIDLSVAETKPSNAQYRIAAVQLIPDDPATTDDEGRIRIELLGQNNEPVNCAYHATTTPTATTLIVGLNKANLSTAYAANATTGSLKQRIAHRLVTMGESTLICGKTLTGSLAGAVP
jgi:hypothetical protein